MRENRKEKNQNSRKWYSILGFLISIFLLTLAIILSMNEEKVFREAKIDKTTSNTSKIEQASSEISKTVNEVKAQNYINDYTNYTNNTNSGLNNNESLENSAISNETNQNTVFENSAENVVKENLGESNTLNENNENVVKNNEIKDSDVSSSDTNNNFIKPVEGEDVLEYSMESLTYSNTLGEWITHRGIDIKADKTTVVKASKDGKVKSIKEDPRYGLSITIEHSGGFETVYSSLLSSEFVKEGDEVSQGQSIGTVGNSAVFETLEGSHLHFEILKDGEYVNPDIYVK